MRRDSLWFHQDFRQLWAGQTVSQFGTYVGQTVLPLLAATTLKASPFQMGILAAAGTAAFLLIGLPTGVLVDRIRRRPVMLTADFARAALLFTVPLAAWVGVLTLAQLITVAFLVSIATVLFDVAYQSYLPCLVGRVQLMEGNTRLQSSLSAAEVMGPGVGGGLAQLIGAATSALTTAVSYLASGLLLLRIRTPEPRLVGHDGTRVRTQTKEGLAFVLGEKSLRAITISTALSNWAITILLSMQMLFLTRDLGLAPGAVGAVLALSGAGGLLGALTAGRCAQWIGPARAIWLIPLVVSPVALVVPIAEPGRIDRPLRSRPCPAGLWHHGLQRRQRQLPAGDLPRPAAGKGQRHRTFHHLGCDARGRPAGRRSRGLDRRPGHPVGLVLRARPDPAAAPPVPAAQPAGVSGDSGGIRARFPCLSRFVRRLGRTLITDSDKRRCTPPSARCPA